MQDNKQDKSYKTQKKVRNQVDTYRSLRKKKRFSWEKKKPHSCVNNSKLCSKFSRYKYNNNNKHKRYWLWSNSLSTYNKYYKDQWWRGTTRGYWHSQILCKRVKVVKWLFPLSKPKNENKSFRYSNFCIWIQNNWLFHVGKAYFYIKEFIL